MATIDGRKSLEHISSPSVSYEVDGYDPGHATGWSVLVKVPAELRTAARLPRTWTPSPARAGGPG